MSDVAALLPRGSKRAAATALKAKTGERLAETMWMAEITLTAAQPLIERDARRKMARHLLALTDGDDLYECFYVWRAALRKATRGEALPELPAEDPKENGQ